MVEGVAEVAIVMLGKIGTVLPVASDQAASPANAFGAVHSRVADQVFRDALPHQIGY